MHLLTDDLASGQLALARVLAHAPDPTGAVYRVEVAGRHLLWARAEVGENLHLFTDGVLLGTLRAAEPVADEPIVHDGPIPADLHPLLPAIVVRDAARTVEPIGITSCYWAPGAVSARQLVVAAALDLRPGPFGTAVFLAAGAFQGNLTLFDEVARIPHVHRLDLDRWRVVRTRDLVLPKADDDALIERLRSLVDPEAEHVVALSGGHDSRFVLGVLAQATDRVRTVSFDLSSSGEHGWAEPVARQAGVPYAEVGTMERGDDARPVAQQVVLTDAQIYARVPQWGLLRRAVGPTDLVHSGHFADSLVKNGFKAAWKVPDPRRPFFERLVAMSSMTNAPAHQGVLRAYADRPELTEALVAALDYERELLAVRSHRQLANWHHYLSRASRWSQAILSDTAFDMRPVFLMGDLDAQLLGVASGAWENFNNDRLRRLNRRLLPMVDAPYTGGRSPDPRRGVAGAIDKVTYEYGHRLQAFRRGRSAVRAAEAATSSAAVAPTAAGAPTTPSYVDELPASTPAGWDRLFAAPMAEVVSGGHLCRRRSGLAVAHVLALLEAPSPAPGAAPIPVRLPGLATES